MMVLRSEVIVLNAFYGKKEGTLDYKERNKFLQVVLKKLCKNHYMFIVKGEESKHPYYEFMDIRYLYLSDEILLFDNITEDKIDEINSIYDDDVKKLIVEAREEFYKENDKEPQRNHKRT